MPNNILAAANAVLGMDMYLQSAFSDQPKKQWKNTYIYHQLEKRKAGGTFTIADHIRGMVYSMLSSAMSWNKVETYVDVDTGRITAVDEVFHQYDIDYLMNCNPSNLRDSLKDPLHLASLSTRKQMSALIYETIEKLLQIDSQLGIDTYYQQFLTGDRPLNNLVRQLSSPDSADKLKQMGVALTAEYLKNVGYDLGKPDRHICRILGSTALGCSEMKIVPVYEALDIISDIATELNKPAAEVDYILWSYCANGYGEICTKKNPKHEICVASQICNYKEW